MTLLPPVFVVQAMTAHVGPVPSTRGPFVIFTACAFVARLGAAVAEAAKAAVKTTTVNNLMNSIPPSQNDSNTELFDAKRQIQVFTPLSAEKALCLQLLSCLCYTQKHAQLDARAHEAP
jgi:hypothetical protein